MSVTKIRPSTQLRTDEIVLPGEPNVFTDVNTFTGLRIGTRAVGGDYAMLSTDFELLVDASAGAVTITLPPAAGTGQYYRIKKIDDTGNVVTIQADGSDLIDDSISVALIDQWSSCVIIDAAFAFWDNASSVGDVGGVSEFTELSDVPGSYLGASLQSVRVNSGETALEFYTPSDSISIGLVAGLAIALG